jgi:hypothetical protein
MCTRIDLTQMILDFGKYKGTAIEDVPVTYMIFLAGYTMHGTRRTPCTTEAYRWVKANRDAACGFAKAHLKNRCWRCQGKLVPVGQSRCRGADHDDWDTRYLHKKCWRLLKRNDDWFSEGSTDDEDAATQESPGDTA